MKKPTLIIDIDDTIADTQVHMLEWINARSQRQYVWGEINRSFREGLQPEYQAHMMAYLSTPENTRKIAPYKNALAAIQILHARGYELHIVTARDSSFANVTNTWLREHGFSDFIGQIHLKPDHQSGQAFKRAVATIIQPLAAFDDTYDVGIELATAGVYVYLINKPWNMGERVPVAMERVSSFTSGVQRFLQRA
jgi:phosphoglycolate phosphatase-like HAD superfamily hydrolase